MRLRSPRKIRECGIPERSYGGGRIFPLYRSDGDIVGHINSSQDGAICHERAIVPCLTSGHGNCPKVILYEDMDDTDERERT